MRSDLDMVGPLLTPGFVARELPGLLTRLDLNPSDAAATWKQAQEGLHAFAETGGPVRVLRHVIEPASLAFGYREVRRQEGVSTREGIEDSGYLLRADCGPTLRAWALGSDTDLESASKHNSAARGSPARRAVRVLRACGETIGLITNGLELRLLLCDPTGPDSHIAVPLAGRQGWASRLDVPDSYLLIAALASPRGVAAVGEIFDAGRLHQTTVTKALRSQARAAIEEFLRCVLDRNINRAVAADPRTLWRQALTVVYRLLFILKLESGTDPGRGFGFAAAEAWRQSLSPNRALGPLARRHLDLGQDTGRLLEDGLRILFQVCREGLAHSSFAIPPLGGGLFDPAATDVLDGLQWGERAAALLLDRLLWTVPKGRERERVHYGFLDVEELGRVYESLLDLEPDIAASLMIRTSRGRLEVVVPATRPPDRGEEVIPSGQFFLRTGLGRRAGGSYYTPHEFVRFLVRETLGPLVAPPIENADPSAILRIKVIDPAMGSGHFLVEACRFLADALYESCHRCDALGTPDALARIDALPDPDRRLSCYLPGRSHDTSDSGPSRERAQAICRRLVAVHCLYGVDCDPLAVELAKLSLWLESFAEGLPLTFLDHRLIVGDSISGPFFSDLSRLPIGGDELDPLLARGVLDRLRISMAEAMREVHCLEASIGADIADILAKENAKRRLDQLARPLRALARAWSGAVAVDTREANDAWLALARSVADTGDLPGTPHRHQAALLEAGDAAVPLDLMFPEVFRPGENGGGFQAVLGNPPWDVVHYQTKEFLARFDPAVMDAPTKRERDVIERNLLRDPAIEDAFQRYKAAFVERKRLCDRLFPRSGPHGSIDLFQIFAERMLDCISNGGAIGLVVPSSFHANEGTAHLRRKLLRETSLESCFSFENRKKLFDIHGRLKFTLLVARRTGPTESFRCAFYLDSIAGLTQPDRIMIYDRAFIAATGGEHETFLELRGQTDLRVARHMFTGQRDMRTWMAYRNIVFGREAHMTDDSHRFTPISDSGDALPLHEGKTFHQYTDRWKATPRYAIRRDAIEDKPNWLRASGHYRLVFREIARSTDERTMISAIVPPGHVFGHKGTCEKIPWIRPDSMALILCAVLNSFPFDWCVRQKIAASISLFMLNSCPAPNLPDDAARFLAHGALRLSCGHAGYEPLWHAQLGSAYSFPKNVATSEDGAELRASMDAVVARSYGLARDQYRHILTGFSHKTNPLSPLQCLEAFDALTKDGSQAFYRKHDPFSDVPLAA
ncbi:MAG: hypothetical protein EXR07_12885 [Acetobacteraceae bacterium]|nr:hypothetical protein [Acetobacteraceae bacterium]